MAIFHWQEATPADEPAVLGLMTAFYAEDHLVFALEPARAAVRTLLATPSAGSLFLLRGADDEVGGYLAATFGFSLEFRGRFVLLDEFYIAPAHRGRGFGRAALTHAAEWARRHGVASVRLEVNRANVRALAFYLAAGFTDDRRDLLTLQL